jgi:predicted membrane protein
LATLVLIAATITDRWDGDTLRETPSQATEVRSDYTIDGGELVVDLRNVADLQDLDGRTISVEGGVGHLHVILPRDLDAQVAAEVTGAGDIDIFDESADGIDVASLTATTEATTSPLSPSTLSSGSAISR